MNKERQRAAVAVGRVLRRARIASRLTQEQVAEGGDLSRDYPSHIERGIKQPTIETFLRFCKGVKAEPDAVLRKIMSELNPEKDDAQVTPSSHEQFAEYLASKDAFIKAYELKRRDQIYTALLRAAKNFLKSVALYDVTLPYMASELLRTIKSAEALELRRKESLGGQEY